MKIQTAIVIVIISLWQAACAPAAPLQATGTPELEPTHTSMPATEELAPTSAPPTETVPVVDTAEIETQEEEPPATPIPTATAWELVQQTIEAFRNRLDRNSDGYQGLTTALEQPEPNEAWCGGLNAAIGDFNYVNDEESALALSELQQAQGCN